MKELVRRLILLITIAATASLMPKKASATHLVGSDISYTCLGGNTYRIDLTFYRDCRGSAAPLGVGIEFRSASCNQYFTDTLLLVTGTGNEITYPCPTLVTSCDDPASTIPGIQEYQYSGIITFPMQCADWVISWSYCCRNCDITTMLVASPCLEGTNPGMYIAATLDNLNLSCNSSPRFTNIPVAFLCVGQNFTYNHGVIDPDGDSLVYSLVNPLINATDSIPFLPGYSATNPITSSPAFAINSATGDLTLTPTQIEVGVVSVLVEEYRNGVLIGSVVRDMEIYVRACSNNLPTASGINGGASRDTSVCPGTNLCFNILSNDIDPNQIVTMSWNQGITGATFTVSGFPFPTGQFCWTPSPADVRPTPYTFTVTVTDDACPNVGFQTYSFQVFVNSPLYTATGTDISCNGANDGVATVVPGSGSLTYVWSPGGQTTASISGLAAGTYTVTITDTVTGCVGQSTVTINDPAVLTVATATTNPPCAGSNSGIAVATPAGGTPGFTYSWNTVPPTLNDTATGLAPGTYIVTVTDSRNCTATANATINPSAPAVNVSTVSVTDLQCNGDANGTATVAASGGTPSYTYSWNTVPPQSGTTATGLSGGTYIVTVTDSLGCVGTDTVNIDEPAAIVIAGSSTQSTCGASDGTASASASGGTPFSFGYQYLWSVGGQTTTTITGLAAGAYTVTVTDSNGCTSSLPVTVSDSNILPPIASAIQSVLCNGQTNGIAVAVPQNGTPPFTFSWNTTPVQTNDTAFNLGAGIYAVGITDANGCSSFDTVQITEPAPINLTVLSSDASCYNDSSGIGVVSIVNGGTPNYTYDWQPYGGTNASVTNLIAGNYTVTVTDANGCTGTSAISISEPSQITVTVNSTIEPTCYGGSDGSIDISVSGGTGGFDYFWNPGGATSQDLSSVDAGIYIVTITDDNGCTFQQTVNLNQPSPVNAFAGNDTALCVGNSIQLQATLGAGMTGQWTSSTGASFVNATNPTTVANNLQPGFNSLTWTVTDADGCSGLDELTIFNYTNIAANAGSDTAFCGLGFVQLNATNVAGFSGSWISAGLTTFDNPVLSNAVATLIDYGTDTLNWTITNGACTTTDYLLITAAEPVNAEAGDYQLVCANDAVLIARGFINGVGIWSVVTGSGNLADPTNDSTSVTDLPVGNTVFLWTITNGPCSAADTVSVDYDNACELELPSGFSPNGDGKNDGYHIKGIEGYPDNVFRVFNRWGNLVYDKEDYVNEDWVGQNNSGDPLPDGTYFVVLEVVGKNLRKSTYVDLRRQ